MRNFDYLQDIEALKDLYVFCSAAEDTQQTNYDVCALNGRRALEWIVKAIYTLKGIRLDERTSLMELMTSEPFTQFVGDDDKLLMAAHYVRKIGKKAEKTGGVKGGEAYFTLLNIYNVVGGILLKLRYIPSLAPFRKDLIPKSPALTVVPQAAVPNATAQFVKSVEKTNLEAPQSIEGKVDCSEAETRKLFIDLLLEEADLMVLLQRRGRSGITDLSIKDEITDREYQKRAIKNMCEHFNAMHRRGLIVMATGTGKTRVAISLCDVLIIIDEVHRSIFGKYTSILSYFDALMVGLTATPREDDDKDTYDLFGCESGEPNFEYLLGEAVADGYLVDKVVLSRTTDILKNGIRYNKLSKQEKEQMESIWQYEKAKFDIPDEADYSRDIESDEIFSYIYNVDTVNKELVDLMENGLKINGGDTIGKTIIFAHRHKHAELIVERFKELYPSLGDEFCQLIDNQVNYAQSIIDAFEVRGKMPMIAVSVDMLDTGIDVPDILNLVLFKQVRSKIKFLQMIGRGTRLSEEIFDEGETPADRAKKFFYIFDWCGNFEFFGENPEGFKPLKSVSLTERLFDLRVDLAIALQHERFQNDEVAKALHDETKAVLQGQVQGLNDKHISVREHWDLVDKYRKKDTWTYQYT